MPGIFFKYDIEPMSLKIEERTMGFIDFAIRLAGIVGGILVCSGYAWRGEHQRNFATVSKLIKTALRSLVGHAAARAAKRQLTGAESKGGVSRGEKRGLMPIQSPQKGLLTNGYRTSYL